MLFSKGIITGLQKKILSVFSKLPDSEHFYLTGGTALTDFFLGHRRSFDLDLFTTEQKLILPFSRVFEETLKKEFCLSVVRRFASFAEIEISAGGEQTKIQLSYDSPFRFEKPVDSDLAVKVNDYKDLIVDKLLAFFGRTEPRDAVDLFFILQTENIGKLVKSAQEKDPGFDMYWFAIALEKTRSFPDSIEKWPVEMLIEVDARRIKDLFVSIAKGIMDDIRQK